MMLHIRHKKLNTNFFDGKKVLDLGCGRSKLNGAIGFDHKKFSGVDIVGNLEEKLLIDDESFDIVHANQVMEHVNNFIDLVYEIHRILRPGGIFIMHVPYYKSSWAHIDPTHVRSFTIQTMNFFVKDNYIYDEYRFRDISFSSLETFLDNDYKSTFLRGIFTNLALRYPEKYENSFLSYLYQFEQLTFMLKK